MDRESYIIEADKLPPALRQGIADGSLVRVHIEEIPDIPLKPEMAAAAEGAIADAKAGRSVTPTLSVTEAIDYLDSEEATRFARGG